MALTKGVLTEEFRKRRRGLRLGEQLPLLLEHTHPLSGARLVVARIERKPWPVQGRYVAGWVAPDENVLWFYRNVETERQARLIFKDRREAGPPDRPHFHDDPQISAVYGWQDHFQFHSRPLALAEMESVTGKLAAIFNMKAPGVTYKPNSKRRCDAEAILDKNEIRMYRPYLSMLLHEFAHLLNDQVNCDKWAWHGPGFMRTFLSVLSLFPEVAGERDLEKLARESGQIKIADADDVPSCGVLKDWLRRTHQTDDPSTIPSLI